MGGQGVSTSLQAKLCSGLPACCAGRSLALPLPGVLCGCPMRRFVAVCLVLAAVSLASLCLCVPFPFPAPRAFGPSPLAVGGVFAPLALCFGLAFESFCLSSSLSVQICLLRTVLQVSYQGNSGFQLRRGGGLIEPPKTKGFGKRAQLTGPLITCYEL